MILLKRKTGTNTYFEFDKIIESGYRVKEDSDRITQKFVNGNRKQIVSTYTDAIIEIDLGTFDGTTTQTYLSNLISGEYMYYSLKDGQLKSANFIIEEKPQITIENAVDSVYVSDFTVKLLKASDISA